MYLPVNTQEHPIRLQPSTVDKPVMYINISTPMQYFMKTSKMNKAVIK